jgi:flagellar basal body-associated protein FliL
MGFLDDIGDALTGKTSKDASKAQQDMQAKALEADLKQDNSTMIYVVIGIVLLILGVMLYLILNTSNKS